MTFFFIYFPLLMGLRLKYSIYKHLNVEYILFNYYSILPHVQTSFFLLYAFNNLRIGFLLWMSHIYNSAP